MYSDEVGDLDKATWSRFDPFERIRYKPRLTSVLILRLIKIKRHD